MTYYGKRHQGPARAMANGGEIDDTLEVEFERVAQPEKVDEPEIPDAPKRESVGNMDGLETKSYRASDNYGDRDGEVKAPAPRKSRPMRKAPKVGGDSNYDSRKYSASSSAPNPKAPMKQSAREAKHMAEFDDVPLNRGIKRIAEFLTPAPRDPSAPPSPYAGRAEWAAYRARQSGNSGRPVAGMANGGAVGASAGVTSDAQLGGGRKHYGKR